MMRLNGTELFVRFNWILKQKRATFRNAGRCCSYQYIPIYMGLRKMWKWPSTQIINVVVVRDLQNAFSQIKHMHSNAKITLYCKWVLKI